MRQMFTNAKSYATRMNALAKLVRETDKMPKDIRSKLQYTIIAQHDGRFTPCVIAFNCSEAMELVHHGIAVLTA